MQNDKMHLLSNLISRFIYTKIRQGLGRDLRLFKVRPNLKEKKAGLADVSKTEPSKSNNTLIDPLPYVFDFEPNCPPQHKSACARRGAQHHRFPLASPLITVRLSMATQKRGHECCKTSSNAALSKVCQYQGSGLKKQKNLG